MAIKLFSHEVTEYELKFESKKNPNSKKEEGEKIRIRLRNDGFRRWCFATYDLEVTIKELVEICEIIYSEGILETDCSIAVYIKKGEYIYIHNSNTIMEDIINTVTIKTARDMLHTT